MSLQPLEDRIVVRPGDAEETTVSGLVIPDTAKEKPQQGEVLAVGPGPSLGADRRADPASTSPSATSSLYSKYGGTEITRRRRGPARALEPRRARQGRRRQRQEEVALTNHRSGGPGRPPAHPEAGDGPGGRGGALGFTRVGRPVRSPSTGSAAIRRLRAAPAASARARRPGGGGARCPLFEEHGDVRLVLTRRPETMPSHRGEIAFPGGKVEAGGRPRSRATPRCARRRRRSASAASWST